MAGRHAPVPRDGKRSVGNPERICRRNGRRACWSVFTASIWSRCMGSSKTRATPDEDFSDCISAKKKSDDEQEAYGVNMDDFLEEEGIFEEAQAQAVKEMVAWQLAEAMREEENLRGAKLATLLQDEPHAG